MSEFAQIGNTEQRQRIDRLKQRINAVNYAGSERYSISWEDMEALCKYIQTRGSCDALYLAFAYGKAQGIRCERNRVKREMSALQGHINRA